MAIAHLMPRHCRPGPFGKNGASAARPRVRSGVLSESRVTFAPMSRAQIAAYVASGEPMGKAGAYAVQGRAAAHLSHISGSYSGIMGLPLFETAQLRRSFRL